MSRSRSSRSFPLLGPANSSRTLLVTAAIAYRQVKRKRRSLRTRLSSASGSPARHGGASALSFLSSCETNGDASRRRYTHSPTSLLITRILRRELPRIHSHGRTSPTRATRSSTDIDVLIRFFSPRRSINLRTGGASTTTGVRTGRSDQI